MPMLQLPDLHLWSVSLSDVVRIESDLIFDDEMITEILEDNRKNLALVAKYERWINIISFIINFIIYKS